jgi:hypothetical protein
VEKGCKLLKLRIDPYETAPRLPSQFLPAAPLRRSARSAPGIDLPPGHMALRASQFHPDPGVLRDHVPLDGHDSTRNAENIPTFRRSEPRPNANRHDFLVHGDRSISCDSDSAKALSARGRSGCRVEFRGFSFSVSLAVHSYCDRRTLRARRRAQACDSSRENCEATLPASLKRWHQIGTKTRCLRAVFGASARTTLLKSIRVSIVPLGS